MSSVMNPMISNAIVNAKDRYGSDFVDVIIDYDNDDNEKIFIMYHDRHNSFAIDTFDYTEYTSAKDIEVLCYLLDLGFDNYL